MNKIEEKINPKTKAIAGSVKIKKNKVNQDKDRSKNPKTML